MVTERTSSAPAASSEFGIALALDLLKRLNKAVDDQGNRLSATVTVSGFEPWWFIQEQLLWGILVPYVKHRSLFQRILSGEVNDVSSLPSGVQAVWALLSKDINPPMARMNGALRARGLLLLRSLIRLLGWLALALISLASLVLFRLDRRNTLVYAIDKVSPGLDHDFRISNIYRELRRRRYRFGEYVHRGRLHGTLNSLWRRQRPVVFFEALSQAGAWLLERWSGGYRSEIQVRIEPADADSRFLKAVAGWALRQSRISADEVRVLRLLLRLHGARRAIILDDSRHVYELIAACKSSGIPTLGYMHGLLNKYHPGLMAYGFVDARRHVFDHYGIWSSYFLRRLTAGDLFSEANTFVCGPLRPPSQEDLQAILDFQPRRIPPIRVLFISEPRAPQEEVLRYLSQILTDQRFQVMMKLRDGEQRPDSSKPGGAMGKQLNVVHGGSVYEAFAQSDVIVGTYSTALYEAILALHPVVVLNTSFIYGHEIVRDGLAEFAESPDQLADTLLQAASHSRVELLRRREIVWGEEISDGASALFDMAEEKLWQASAVG